MRKKLSLVIALAITLSTATTTFAAAENVNTNNTTNSSTQVDTSTLSLTMDEALSSIEKNNTEINLMKKKIDVLNKQYDLDHDIAIQTLTDGAGT